MAIRKGVPLVLAATLVATAGAAFGQAAPATPSQPVPETDVGQAAGSLSHKLNQTGGVISPKGSVDPAMQKPAPAAGTTPVIPPPGSPGGDPTVQPK